MIIAKEMKNDPFPCLGWSWWGGDLQSSRTGANTTECNNKCSNTTKRNYECWNTIKCLSAIRMFYKSISVEMTHLKKRAPQKRNWIPYWLLEALVLSVIQWYTLGGTRRKNRTVSYKESEESCHCIFRRNSALRCIDVTWLLRNIERRRHWCYFDEGPYWMLWECRTLELTETVTIDYGW